MTETAVIPRRISEIVAEQVALAVRAERDRCADIAQLFPVHSYADDQSEILRFRDDISQAIRRNYQPGEPIR